MIFFSLTEAPLPDPTPTPPNTPKRTRDGPEIDPKRSQTDPKRTEMEVKWTEIKLFGVWDGRGDGGRLWSSNNWSLNALYSK